jgi:tripartite-type tricarboxylate transporter receptor subunit TctC
MFKKIATPLLSAAVLLAGPALAQGDAYPTKTITLVVPYSAGGPADMLGRMVAERLGPRLGQQILIDNRPGAGGHIGGAYVAASGSDGHTLMLGTIAHHGASDLYTNLRYDPALDLKAAAIIAESPSVLLVHDDVPAKSLQELLALARKDPGKLTYASAGTGSAMHMAAELFRHMADIDYLHVPYRGGAPAMNDLLGGQVNLLFDNLGTAHPHLKGGKVRALAVTSGQRSPSLPDVPTVSEAGVPGYESVPWYTIAVSKDVPDAIMQKLNTEINAVLKAPDLVQRWNSIGVVPVGGSVADAAKRNAAEKRKWSAVIKAANLQIK